MIRNLLVLPDGSELFSGVAGENAISEVTLTHCVNAEEELTPGAVCAGMLEMKVIVPEALSLAAGEEITLYTVAEDGARNKEGIFIAEKPRWERANCYSITAYDRVSLLDKDLTGWLKDLSGWPYSLLDFAGMVCAECGLELITTQIPNGDYRVQAFSAEGITGRQLMQWAGQIAGRFCRATPDGKIEFAWYEKTAKTFGASEKYEQTEPGSVVYLEELEENTGLQAITQLPPSEAGWESMTLYQCGKNLFDPQKMVGMKRAVFDEETGLWVVDTKKQTGAIAFYVSLLTTGTGQMGKRDVTNLIRVPPNTPVTIWVEDWSAVATDDVTLNPNNYYMSYGWYRGDGTCHSMNNLSARQTVLMSPDLEPCYLDIRRNNPSVVISFRFIQVEIGAEATDYAPYRQNQFSLSFGEKIYGGSLNWATGKLQVEYGKAEDTQTPYPLEEPYEITLAPVSISALEGRNCLWSQGGNTILGAWQSYYFQNSLSFEDFRTAPVEKVQIRLTDSDVGAVYPDDPQATNAYILSGNYLLTNGETAPLEEVAKNLYKQLEGITYTPCKLDISAMVDVRAGDIISVFGPRGRQMTVYVMSKIRSGQKLRLECTGSQKRDSVFAVNEQSYRALSGKVMELKTHVEGLHAENRDARGSYANLALTVEGIVTEVKQQDTKRENLEEQMSALHQTASELSFSVQSLKENGASKVRTQMGYTFDDEGLKISREDTEMTNLLDNTGMYVRRGSDLVLQANNDGVEAINIKVRNYLNVGENARFEDYNDGSGGRRTACFFTGG